MKSGLTVFAAACAALGAGLLISLHAQPIQRASNFSSVEYYEAPHEQQIKSRLSGADAQPTAGGLLMIKQLRLETFATDGKMEMVVTAPECIYDALNGVASSPGHFQMLSGDGKFSVEGDGFLWQQTNSCLNISNSVRTVIQGMPVLPTAGKAARK